MRRHFEHPAEQLGSVAGRFRRRARRGVGVSCPWQGVRFPANRGESPSRNDESKSSAAPAAERLELSFEEKQRRVEAVLFVAREPLSSRKLSHYAGLADGTEARTIVKRLNARYDASGRAFRVESIAGGHQLLTRPKFGDWVRRAAHAPAHQRLSSPALETLAVIAYRQPIPRVEIEAIRGVNCGEMLRQLMDRDLVRIGGRSDELGRPYLYATTRRFLQSFGLTDIAELPNADLYGRAKDAIAPDTITVPQPGLKSTNQGLAPTNPDVPEEKSDVTITTFSETRSQDHSRRRAASLGTADGPRRLDQPQAGHCLR
jgi:segregation and condensation protein B